jgi:hypothetical protein
MQNQAELDGSIDVDGDREEDVAEEPGYKLTATASSPTHPNVFQLQTGIPETNTPRYSRPSVSRTTSRDTGIVLGSPGQAFHHKARSNPQSGTGKLPRPTCLLGPKHRWPRRQLQHTRTSLKASFCCSIRDSRAQKNSTSRLLSSLPVQLPASIGILSKLSLEMARLLHVTEERSVNRHRTYSLLLSSSLAPRNVLQ